MADARSSKVNAPVRELRFSTLEELEEELGRIEDAYVAGTLESTGNWSPGKILGHLAAWIDYGFDGYPMRAPFFVRAIGRLMKNAVMKQPTLKPGLQIPGAPGGTYGTEEMDVPEGAAMLRTSIERLRMQTPPAHPIFGPLTAAEWNRLHLGHAALHLGFLRY
jgi:hypothetical protein